MWWFLMLGGLIGLIVVVALVAAIVAVNSKIPTSGGTVATDSLAFDFGLVSVLSTTNPPVFTPAAPTFMVIGDYYPMLIVPPQNIFTRSATNNSTKFSVNGSLGEPPTAMVYTPNFLANPSGHITITGSLSVDGFLTTIGNFLVMLRCALAFSLDVTGLTNPIFLSEVNVRMDTTAGELAFQATVPFSVDLISSNIPGGKIAIFAAVMVDTDNTNFGTHAVSINVQEVPYIFKAVT